MHRNSCARHHRDIHRTQGLVTCPHCNRVFRPSADTLTFAATCRRSNNKLIYEPLVWRRHCTHENRYWLPSHELKEKLQRPPAQTKWRLLFNERRKTDAAALELFNALLLEQQHRVERMEKVAKMGLDVKELIQRQRDETPEDAEDVLARRYHANAILGQIHRGTTTDKWLRLSNRQMVRLEEVLGAYDLFVVAGRKGSVCLLNWRFLTRNRARLTGGCFRDEDLYGFVGVMF